MLRSPKNSEFLKTCDNFAEFWQNFNGILMCKDSNDTVAQEPYLSTLLEAGEGVRQTQRAQGDEGVEKAWLAQGDGGAQQAWRARGEKFAARGQAERSAV